MFFSLFFLYLCCSAPSGAHTCRSSFFFRADVRRPFYSLVLSFCLLLFFVGIFVVFVVFCPDCCVARFWLHAEFPFWFLVLFFVLLFFVCFALTLLCRALLDARTLEGGTPLILAAQAGHLLLLLLLHVF